MTFSWHRRSTHCGSCSRCMHTRRDPDSEPYAIVRDQDNARDLLITRPRLAWVRRRGGRGSLFRSSSVGLPRRVEDGFGIGLRGGGDADDVCCCGARSFDPLTRGCACCQERRRPDGCVHIARRRSWGWGRVTRSRDHDDRHPILDEEYRIQTRFPLPRGSLRPRNRINSLADRFSDLALNLRRRSPPPSLSSRPLLRSRSRSRPRFYSDASPSTPRTIPVSIPRSRTRTQTTIRSRHALSPRSRRSHRSRGLTRSLTPSSSLRLGTSRSPPPTVRFRTPTPTPSTPVSADSCSFFLPPSRRRGAMSAASGPPPPLLADMGLYRERERRPYLRRGSALSPPADSRLGLGLGSPSYCGVGLSSEEDDDAILDQLRRGRSMTRRHAVFLGVDEDEDVGLGLGLGVGRGQAEGLHIPRMRRRYAMPAARERQRQQELGFGGRLRGEEG